MTLGRRLLLGLAAATLLVSAGRAEDPRFRRAQAESNQACPAHGEGFVRIQGTDTCISVHGSVTYEYSVTGSRR